MSRPVRVAAVGDVMCGETFVQYRRGPRTRIAQRGGDYLPADIVNLLRTHDVVIGNVEAVLSDEGYRPGVLRSHHLRGAPETADLLARWGLTVATVANNHILEHGTAAAMDTARQLRAAGIRVIGAGPRDEFTRGSHAETVIVGDTRVGLLGACLLNERYAFHGGVEENALVDAVRTTAAAHDVTLLALHWGTEYMPRPRRDQRVLAQQLIDAGATAILGHHPHVAQGVGRLGAGLVAYSLGNFIFDQTPADTRWSFILSFEIEDGRVGEPACHPFELDNEHRPTLPPAARRDALMAELDRRHALALEDLDDAEYARQARRAERRSRRSRFGALLRRLPTYPPSYSSQILLRPLLRRLRRW